MKLTPVQRRVMRGVLYVKPSGQEVLAEKGSAVVICHGSTATVLMDTGLITEHRREYVRRKRTRTYREFRLTQEGREVRQQLREER
jgi:hypothetical protein